MDEHAHAQGMAHNCSPLFAQLILQVPTRYSGDNNLQFQLIGVISRLAHWVEARCRRTEQRSAPIQRTIPPGRQSGIQPGPRFGARHLWRSDLFRRR
jgi:hypothetical protein